MRATALLLLLACLATVVAPALIVTDFLVRRERILTEICVQRMVPDEMRTCHGNCYLSRTLRQVDQQERELPNELRSMRLPEMVLTTEAPPSLLPPVAVTSYPSAADPSLCEGWSLASDPVPWC